MMTGDVAAEEEQLSVGVNRLNRNLGSKIREVGGELDMPDDEKKKPEPEPREEESKPEESEKRRDLIVDITGQKSPGWGTSF